MPQHFTIANFKFGLDSRRSELTSVPGTLLVAENGHINQGAQFEKRKAFVKLGQLPNSCFGLQETPTRIVTFGSAAIGTVVIPAGLTGLVTYQRLRHYIWELADAESGLVLPSGGFLPSLNPDYQNAAYEPAMTGIVHSCTFGGKAFAIATFGQSSSPGGNNSGVTVLDAQNPITLCYYNSSTITSCFQGLIPFSNSIPGNVSINDPTTWTAAWFCYVARYYLGSDFTESFGPTEGALGNYLAVNLTGPVNEPFTLVLSDSVGEQISSSTTANSSAEVSAVGASTTFYFTKIGGGGGGSIDTFTAPNVDNGVLTGTVNLITSGVAFNTSLYQTTLDLATAINHGSSGYTAQAQFTGSTIAGITITAPSSFGAVVNASNITINTTGLFTSVISIVKSGAAGAGSYELAGGVTAKLGTGQIEKVNFMDLLSNAGLCQGTYQADLVLNGIVTVLGRGNLTRKRPTFVFFLQSGAAGSVGPITLLDGTNLLSANVAFFSNLSVLAQQIAANINTKWGGGAKPANPNSWGANWIQVGGVDGVAIHGPSVNSPSYGGSLNVTITSTTIKVSATPTSRGLNSLQLSIDSGTSDPTFACSLGGKLYLANGTQINFSASFDSTRWERQDTGAGFFESLDQNGSPSDTIALCPYQGKMAVFNRRSIAIWQVNADPAQYSQTQNLLNIGALAKLSVQPLGDLDVLFLGDTGVRSLRVRDNTLNAFVNDIGSPIDDFITDSLIANTSTANASACAVVEPGSGRYWLYLNGTIYVLSYYPSLKVVAWSTYLPTYDLNGVQTIFVPVKFLSYNGQVYVFDSNNNVYVYGGVNNNTYDGCVATLQTPWLDLKSPQMEKNALRLNMAMSGEWQVQASMDPRAGDLMEVVPANAAATGSEPNDSTFDEGSFAWSRTGTHLQVKAVTSSTWTKAATISSITLQYNNGREV